MTTPRFPLSDLNYDEEEVQAVVDVVRGKWLSLGPRTAEFERRFAEFVGAEHAVCVSSCTAALHLALKACDVSPGDEVLVPSYTFVASVNPIVHVGATPVFVDITGDEDSNLDPGELAAKITLRTKAIIVVHMAGFPANMDRILSIARQYGLAVIEDASHAIGAVYEEGGAHRGRQAGTMGTVGCFSFFANKNLATGEGGMLVTPDRDIADRVRLARSHGMSHTSWDKAQGRATGYDVCDTGFNYRPTEITAALGMVQLKKLPAATERRRDLAARYRSQLAEAVPPADGLLTIPFSQRLQDSAHHIFAVLAAADIDRESLRRRLLERGVQTSIHYPPVHEFSFYRERAKCGADLSRTSDVARREITLPLHPLMTPADVDEICEAVAIEAAATRFSHT